MKIKRGEIYYADLPPAKGSEQGGIRPVLVIQNNVGNTHSPTVVVACITSRSKSIIPTHVKLSTIETGLKEESNVMLEQIKTLDKSRLKQRMGAVPEATISQIDRAIKISFGIGAADPYERKMSNEYWKKKRI
jgi:Growth inhibitor